MRQFLILFSDACRFYNNVLSDIIFWMPEISEECVILSCLPAQCLMLFLCLKNLKDRMLPNCLSEYYVLLVIHGKNILGILFGFHNEEYKIFLQQKHRNKPSFCSGSCDEWHATTNFQKQNNLETPSQEL